MQATINSEGIAGLPVRRYSSDSDAVALSIEAAAVEAKSFDCLDENDDDGGYVDYSDYDDYVAVAVAVVEVASVLVDSNDRNWTWWELQSLSAA